MSSWWDLGGQEVIYIHPESTCFVQVINAYINNSSVSHIHKRASGEFYLGTVVFYAPVWQSGPDRLMFLPVPEI